MNYTKINAALAKEFGKGRVILKASDVVPWQFNLWFRSDKPGRETIEKAKQIVERFEPSVWGRARHVDK